MTKAKDLLTAEQIQQLTEKSNLLGAFEFIVSWGLIFAAMACAFLWPHPLIIGLALVIIGGRQLALSILMHDAAHYAVFKSKALNDFFGQWFAAYPVWLDLKRYRVHHLEHHRWAGSVDDPDYGLVKNFPTSKMSLIRKFLRDLFFITGIKRMYGLLLMDLGIIKYTVASDIVRLPQNNMNAFQRAVLFFRNIKGIIITNLVLFFVVSILFAPWVYLLWVMAYFSTYSLFLRIRSIAEHACTDMDLDPLACTRTTRANLLARLTVAPHHVNYHLEHHLLMVVPSYRLKAFHQILWHRGFYKKAHYSPGYLAVLKKASSQPA